jgi:hypothetical protein
MKEPKFLDLPGYENENTFIQYDQFEQRKHQMLKVRSIVDLSQPITAFRNGPYGEESDLSDSFFGTNRTYNIQYSWPNITYNTNYIWTLGRGFHKDAEILKENHYINFPTGLTGDQENEIEKAGFPDFDYVPTVLNNEDRVPFFSGDTTLYIDSGKGFGGLGQSNLIKYFRAGYLELTFKTNKQNCVLAFGSGTFVAGDTSSAAQGIQEQIFDDSLVAIDSDKAFTQESLSENKEIFFEIKNGKLYFKYTDLLGDNSESFEIYGTENVADDKWHHVVLNIGRPGTLRNFGKKHSKKYIEFWVDGKLDFRTFDFINKKQIFFPTFTWFGSNAKELFKNKKEDAWKTEDSPFQVGVGLVGYDQQAQVGYDSPFYIYNNLYRRKFNQEAKQNIFVGSVNHIVTGLNFSLSKTEIQQRNRLFRGYEKNEAGALSASATFVNPTVSTNKKKALKLFWNNLINENAKNGVELDSSFSVHAYSVTHKSINSSTEINNIDLSNSKEINRLADVRVAITDNVIYWAPGAISDQQYPEKWLIISSGLQWNGENLKPYDSFSIDPSNGSQQYRSRFLTAHIGDLLFSGVQLKSGDRVLLTNQASPKHNGIWLYSDVDSALIRADDSDSYEKIKNAVVHVTDGYYKNSTWKITNNPESLTRSQFWSQLEYYPDEQNINSQPVLGGRWTTNLEESFINLQEHVNVNDYDLITFMNYPETSEQIKEYFVEYDEFEVTKKYNDFITSLKLAAANGASLMVTSPKLAEDLGIVKEFVKIDQEIEDGDGRSAVVNPFQFNEPAERYFDTHRQNAYHLNTLVAGLTDKETWIMTEAISYIPKDEYDYEQWHLKYSYRQFGLQEGNEFLIPSLPLRQVATKDDLPGFRANARSSSINAVAPQNVLAGTVITSLANTHYHGSVIANNEYDDYATTIIVHNGQQLGGTPINGKIFVNCVEDAYTLSREDYNKAIIQVIPNDDPYETITSKQWQYSTSRLNRLPRRINVKELTAYGQTTPTNAGGGPIVQAGTNSSNGIIRSETDRGNKDYQSDLYPQEIEEVYPIQEIPVLSMTWLGLKWLAGE